MWVSTRRGAVAATAKAATGLRRDYVGTALVSRRSGEAAWQVRYDRRGLFDSATGGGDNIGGGGGSSSGISNNTSGSVAETTAWGHSLRKLTKNALIHELTQNQVSTANTLVPWLMDNMPSTYFNQVDEATRLGHLKALSALQGTGEARMEDMSLAVRGRSEQTGLRTITFIRPFDKSGASLMDLINRDFEEGELRRVMLFSSLDEKISLNMFQFADETADPLSHDPESVARLMHFIQELRAAAKNAGEAASTMTDDEGRPMPPDGEYLDEIRVREFLARCGPSFLNSSHPRRFCKHMVLFNTVHGTDGAAVDIEHAGKTDTPGARWVSVAVENVLPQVSLRLTANLLLNFHGPNTRIKRTHLNVIKSDGGGRIAMLRLLVHNSAFEEADWERIREDILRIKWIDDDTVRLAIDHKDILSLKEAEVVTALCSLVHQPLCKESQWAFSRTNIMAMINTPSVLRHAANAARLLLDRLDPATGGLDDATFASRSDQARQQIRSTVSDEAAFKLLTKLVDATAAIYRTNFFMKGRYALSFRVDPALLEPPTTAMEGAASGRPLPLGVFFAHGRRFNGFQVRFREIARGGLRLVTPRTQEQFSIETARHYDENYGLAFAQQLKNKDIPEGGSKAVVLVNSPGMNEETKHFAMRKSFKAFTDSLLDLIVDTPETRANIVDKWGRPEILYLGPDEQVIPEDIDWVIKRAEKRGLPVPAAFMSSKAATGINHKDYGVTSEGVVVFLDVALRHQGIDPRAQPFTVKLTGGPDGDVAGNCIKILHREYGDNARIVGLADGSGCLEDPDGMDMGELLRLVDESLPVSAFNASALGSRAKLTLADDEEGIHARNTMHNRVQSDAFIPAGGRPETVNVTNWRQFLDSDGKPSSGLVVEGANLFFTKEARQLLFEEAGVQIVKDSSANKCGVICSSYEIIASMLCSEAEFTDIKDELVDDVLVKLRSYARLEAELLFSEYKAYPGALPLFSERISRVINLMADELASTIASVDTPTFERLLPIFYNHIPTKLRDLYVERVSERVPLAYVQCALAKCLASEIVYREGTHFVESLPPERLADVAMRYFEATKEVHELVAELRRDELDLTPDVRDRLIGLIVNGGVRTVVRQTAEECARNSNT